MRDRQKKILNLLQGAEYSSQTGFQVVLSGDFFHATPSSFSHIKPGSCFAQADWFITAGFRLDFSQPF